MPRSRPKCLSPALCVLAALLLGACQPTVRVEAPEKPITINLNVKLEADVRLKIEEKAKEDITKNPDIF
ncbi:MAG: YnbE family lipoprotein [Alphaproteobacteria bacterium]